MKVIFLQHVINVWKVWEIKEVKSGYAQNFLLPKWLAKEFSLEEQKRFDDKKKKEEQNRQKKVEHRHELFDLLNWKEFNFSLQKTESWKAFWSIAEKDIIPQLKKAFKIDFTKSEIEMPDWHIKKNWKYDIFVKLGSGEMAKIIIVVS